MAFSSMVSMCICPFVWFWERVLRKYSRMLVSSQSLSQAHLSASVRGKILGRVNFWTDLICPFLHSSFTQE